MKKLKTLASLILVFTFMASISACDKNGTASSGQQTDIQSSTNETVIPESSSAKETVIPESTKAEEILTLTSTKFEDTNIVKYKEGESLTNCVWSRGLEKDLKIKIKYLWVAPTMEIWRQKMNIAIATNDLPDFMQLEDVQYAKALQSNLLADITSVYDNYAEDNLKNEMNQTDFIIDMASYKNKLYSIPQVQGPYDLSTLIWVRKDWMENLGLSQPQTIDDVIAMAKAFAKNDPDKNGKNDTYGIALNSKIFKQTVGSMKGFFEGFHAYVNDVWILKDGKLEFGGIQPEVKNALAALVSLYQEGCIDTEFGVKDASLVSQDFNQGKLGLTYGYNYLAISPFDSWKPNFPDADFNMYPIVSSDNKPAFTSGKVSVLWYTAVNKNCKNPEAVIKIANYGLSKKYGSAEVYKEFMDDGTDMKAYAYSPFGTPGDIAENNTASKAIRKALQNNDPAGLNGTQLTYYNSLMKWVEHAKDATKADWAAYKTFGPGGAWQIIGKEYLDDGKMYVSEFYGAPTQSMGEKKTTLENLQIAAYMKIITGNDDISAFDSFVNEWKSLGGDTMTTEVNEWYKSIK